MPHLCRIARTLVVASLASAPVAARPQGSDWPCAGMVAESSRSSEPGRHGTVVHGELIARTLRVPILAQGSPRDSVLELHRRVPGRSRYELIGLWAPPEWRAMSGHLDLAFDGRVLATQPWLLSSADSHCDLVELGTTGPQLTRVPLDGFRLYSGRLTAIAGDTVFAVNTDTQYRIRLNVLGRDPAGGWRVEHEAEAWGVRLLWPPDDEVFVAATEDRVVVAATWLQPYDYVAAVFERTPSGQWIHAGLVARPSGTPWGRVGGVSGLALDGEDLLLSFQRWPESASAWLYERVAVGRFEVVQSFDGPDLAPAVALGGGHIALTRGTTTELYERSSTGPFTLARRFHGLERVFHLDDTRIAGLTPTGAAVRVVPLAPHGSADVTVCEEGGTVVCEAAAPTGPHLRAFFEYTPWPEFRPRLVAGVEDAPPGALAFAFRASALGPNPAAGGALCLAGPSATRTPPAVVDAFGRASLGFDVSDLSLSALFQEALFVQALVIDGGAVSATEAVRLRL